MLEANHPTPNPDKPTPYQDRLTPFLDKWNKLERPDLPPLTMREYIESEYVAGGKSMPQIIRALTGNVSDSRARAIGSRLLGELDISYRNPGGTSEHLYDDAVTHLIANLQHLDSTVLTQEDAYRKLAQLHQEYNLTSYQIGILLNEHFYVVIKRICDEAGIISEKRRGKRNTNFDAVLNHIAIQIDISQLSPDTPLPYDPAELMELSKDEE